jgi:glycine/D-amino acid oxidase-like deaminating enzyme
VTAVSFWLETAGPRPERSPLSGSTAADVVVVGAGFTGLWTAYYLLRRAPALRVVVCDAEHVGFGASGRNGAWCSAGLAVTPAELARRVGADRARRTVRVMRDTVAEVGRVAGVHDLDIDYRRGGLLRIARGRHELPALHDSWESLRALGLDDGCALLAAGALQRRVRVAEAEAALYDPHCAALHPGKLVLGLARLVEEAGAVIHERTPVVEVFPGALPRVRTPDGDVTATTVVLATEAWMSQLPGFERSVLPLYSLIVLTEPLTDAQWRAVGWDGHECLSSHRYTVDYLSRTADKRILFGGRGAPYHFGSQIAPEHDHHEPTHRMLREQLADWFPALEGIGFTHAWGGPIGMPRDWMPTFRHDPSIGLAGAWGYTGQGVATSNLAGRVLADLITGADSDLLDLPMVNHRSRRWEPEPLRWLATRYMQTALAGIDARARRTGRAPTGRTLPERLLRH